MELPLYTHTNTMSSLILPCDLGWGIIWKLLLSRLGLFRELFNGITGKNSTDDRQTERRRSERKHLQSSLSQRHRTKNSNTIKNRTVTINETGTQTQLAEDSDIQGKQKEEPRLSQTSEWHKDWT